jgi:hypothetical protein
MAGHEVFGKCLTCFELGGGASRTEQGTPAVSEIIRNSGRQRRFGADHGQVGAYRPGQSEYFRRIIGADGREFDGPANTWVSWRANDMPDAGVKGQAPTERVLTRAGAKYEYAHGGGEEEGNRVKIPANNWMDYTYGPGEARFDPRLSARAARRRPV